MQEARRVNASVHWYLEEMAARVVAASGKAADRHHLGKLILQALRDAPTALCQIDGGTGRSEDNGAVLARSVRCARAFGALGLRAGDVIAIAAPNHLELVAPYYAALYTGVAVAPFDRTLTVNELKTSFSISCPKIIFCQSENAGGMQLALNQLEMGARIVTFDPPPPGAAAGAGGPLGAGAGGPLGAGAGGPLGAGAGGPLGAGAGGPLAAGAGGPPGAGAGVPLASFQQFLDTYAGEEPEQMFQCAEFDPSLTLAVLIPTSGSTGAPKYAATTHLNLALTTPYIWCQSWRFPAPTRLQLLPSPLQWLTAVVSLLTAPLCRYPRLQTSLPLTTEHLCHLINTYKPSFAIVSPTVMSALLAESARCDLSCFDSLWLGGSAVPHTLLDEIKSISPRTEVCSVYGMTELTSAGLAPTPGPSCGQPLPCYQYRLVDVETQEDITEPDTNGELWVKGPGVFKGYYKNPSETAATFAAGGWLKTGDMFYRDTYWNFHFVERIKLLLKYKGHHVSPVELESVIRALPGVLDVAVTGVPSPHGERAVACVVRRPGPGPGASLSAEDVKHLVKTTLSETKQLRGGVVFVPELPLTSSGKLHRRALTALVLATLNPGVEGEH